MPNLTPDLAPDGTPNDRRDRLRLIRSDGIGPVTYRRLLDRYRTPTAALAAFPRLARAAGRAAAPVMSGEDAQRELDRTGELGGRIVFLGDPDYPPLLALIDDAPPCLIFLGDLPLAQRQCVAAVGGRNASANGQRMAETLAAELARTLVVVSGLARGIDTAAHLGAMRTGRTIAVIAGGIDQPYPPDNTDLHRRIADTNLLVTEAPIGTVPQARHFPRRNRIIAGLSLGVVVVEAAPRSGSLITARFAQEAGREVFAVPGSPLDPRARGGNDLIRQGAVLVESAADVLDNLPVLSANDARDLPRASPYPGSSGLPYATGAARDDTAETRLDGQDKGDKAIWDERPVPPETMRQVLALLSPEPTTVDDLVRRCQLSPPATVAVLLELELAGRVETLPGNRVALLPGGID